MTQLVFPECETCKVACITIYADPSGFCGCNNPDVNERLRGNQAPHVLVEAKRLRALERVATAYGEFEGLVRTYGMQKMAEMPESVLEESCKAVSNALQKVGEAYKALAALEGGSADV